MRSVRTIVLAGVAVAGLAGLAFAAAPKLHEMTVLAPDGAVAHIRYSGDVAPKVTFVQANPAAVSFWTAPSPFAELDRITALMDRQMAQMMYQARLVEQQAAGDPLSAAMLKDMPAGSSSYSFVSTSAGNGFCMRTTQITSSPNGKPKVVSQTSGNCGSPSNSAVSTTLKAPQPGLQTINYKQEPAQPRHGI